MNRIIIKMKKMLRRIPGVLLIRDLPAYVRFVFQGHRESGCMTRLVLCCRLAYINGRINCVHTAGEMLNVIRSILEFPEDTEGVVVEAGCFKGGSSAKISLAAGMMGRRFFVFDSFEGMPDNQEIHGRAMNGGVAEFPKGSYAGSLEEVKSNIERFGRIEPCDFVKGWFSDSLPQFRRKVAVAYLDVDLAESTKVCLKYLYPLLVKGGVLYSQDGHLPLVCGVFNDDRFWRDEVGCAKPVIEGLGACKLLRIVKE